MDALVAIFLVGFLWITPTGMAWRKMTEKGYSGGAGIVLGLLLGWLGMLIAALLPYKPEALVAASGPTKTCPHCAETIKAEAVVCRYCGRDLVVSA